jgi:Tc5 transposase DNA-binding domain
MLAVQLPFRPPIISLILILHQRMPTQKQNIPPLPKSAAPPKKTGPRCPAYSQKDLENAMEACNPRNPNRISLARAEKLYHVPKSTIRAHILGRKMRGEAHKDEQALTPEEENVLAHYCKIRGYRGVPLEQHEVVAAASEICGKELGKNWIYAFERRHPDLKTRWAKRGETKRASGLNSANVKGYFEDLKEVLQTEDILPKDIYNMDEKGLEQSGGSLRRRVVVDRAQKEPKIHGEEGRQICTILECISAGGFAIPPLLIHTGAEKDAEWLASNPCDARSVTIYIKIKYTNI